MNKPLTSLHYTTQNDLKQLGYTMLHNKEGYVLEIQEYVTTIWVWIRGNRIEVNDWYDRTHDIIEFYKANKDNPKYLNKDYIPIAFDFISGDIIFNDKYEELDKALSKLFGQKKALEEIKKKYEKFRREADLNKNNMDKLILELEKLNLKTKNAGTPVSK